MGIIFSKYRYFFLSVLILLGGTFLIYGQKYLSKADVNEDIVISTNTTWTAGIYDYQDITITNNATLTLQGTYTDNSDGTGVIINARNITVDAGSSISANEQGYARREGPGAGARDGSFNGAGAGYGGDALNQGAAAGGKAYGNPLQPDDLGSGGGSDEVGVGAGGGAIKLNVSDTLDLSGTISANGDAGNKYDGGGSGGSVWIVTSALKDSSGTGLISADGGDTTTWSTAGAGGRVAIYYQSIDATNPYSLTSVRADGGKNDALQYSEDGTVFLINTTTSDVIVNNTLRLDPETGYNQSAEVTTDGNYYFSNLTISNNSTLTLQGKYSDDTDGVGLEIHLSGDLTVESGSVITADGEGYGAASGPGKGLTELSGGTGAGFGGDGAKIVTGGYGTIAAGSSYGSALFPEELGSGGGQVCGGAGGGMIKIISEGDVEIDGEITADGRNGTDLSGNRGGGGSGGSIYLHGSAFSGTGTVTANGGNGSTSGYSGGGGGGRIALYYSSNTIDTSNLTTTAGVDSDSRAATSGTVFLYNTATGDVEVTEDVTFDGNAGVSRDGSKRTDGVYYFNNLTVSNNATVTIAGYYTGDDDGQGVTINLDGGLTVEAGSTITGVGQGHEAQSGPGKGLQGEGNASGGGGSYGGIGGTGAFDGIPGSVYGDTEKYYPYFLGSGGGNCNGGTGGAGGSALSIRSLGDVVIAGDINLGGANGGTGTSSFGSGGGSGGSIFLSGNSFSGAGNIKADGGNGGAAADGGGAGGGGRVSIAYFDTFTMNESNVTADGGTGSTTPARDGAIGTVYIRKMDLPSANFDLVNPNNNSTQYTNSLDVDLDPEDPDANAYYESANGDLTPPFYAQGWHQVSEGKELTEGEGLKTVRAWMKDNNQLISSAIGEATIVLDQTNPEVLVPTPSGNTVSPTTTISGTVSDNLSGVASLTVQAITLESPIILFNPYGQEVTVNEDGTFSVTIALSVGDNQVTFTATDGAGNTSTESLAVTRDSASSDSETTGDDSDQDTNPDTSGTVTGTNGNSNDSTATTENDESISDNTSEFDQVNDNGLLEQTRDAIRTIGGCLLGNCPSKTKTAVTYFFFGAAVIGAIGYFLFIVLFKKKKQKK